MASLESAPRSDGDGIFDALVVDKRQKTKDEGRRSAVLAFVLRLSSDQYLSCYNPSYDSTHRHPGRHVRPDPLRAPGDRRGGSPRLTARPCAVRASGTATTQARHTC